MADADNWNTPELPLQVQQLPEMFDVENFWQDVRHEPPDALPGWLKLLVGSTVTLRAVDVN